VRLAGCASPAEQGGSVTTIDEFTDLTSEQFIEAVADGSIYPYTEHRIPKRRGGLRTLHAPIPRLSEMQQEVLARLEALPAKFQPHPAAFAYRRGRSVVDCAAVHLRAHTVIRLDIADFFGSIRERHIHAALKEAWLRPTEREYRIGLVEDDGCQKIGLRRTGHTLDAYVTARLVTVSPPGPTHTWRNRGTGRRSVRLEATGQEFSVHRPGLVHRRTREGFLPQGAPTSGYLSNIVMRDVDATVTHLAESLGLRYTRYSDDMHFSSHRLVHHDDADRLVSGVKRALEPLGMRLNARKTYVARPGARRSVLGVLVDGPAPRLTREYKRRITKHVRGAASFGIEQHRRHQEFKNLTELDAHVTGLLSFAHMVEPGWAERRLADWKRLREIPLEHEGPAVLQHGLDLPWEDGETEATQADLAKASIDDLVRGAQRYRSSSDYLQMLEFVGRFKRYAPFNAMVVHIQKPGARYVLSSSEWESTYRRVLKPGAQPLLIFQPRGPYMLVYDVGDTEALPGALPLPKGITAPVSVSSRAGEKEIAEVWHHTETNLAPLGIRLTLVDHAASSCGRTYRSRSCSSVKRPGSRPGDPSEAYPTLFEIEINRNLPLLDRYATLAHELGHLFCGHLGADPGETWPDRYVQPLSDEDAAKVHARNEVEAESIAYMVLKRLDLDVRMGDYITRHLGPGRQVPETVALNLTFKAAGLIIEMGKKRIPAAKLRKPKK
jgi:hypothetical protein